MTSESSPALGKTLKRKLTQLLTRISGKQIKRSYDITAYNWDGENNLVISHADHNMYGYGPLTLIMAVEDPEACWMAEVMADQSVYMYRHTKYVEDPSKPVCEIRYGNIEEAPEWVKSSIGTLKLTDDSAEVSGVGVRISADDFLLYEPK